MAKAVYDVIPQPFVITKEPALPQGLEHIIIDERVQDYIQQIKGNNAAIFFQELEAERKAAFKNAFRVICRGSPTAAKVSRATFDNFYWNLQSELEYATYGYNPVAVM